MNEEEQREKVCERERFALSGERDRYTSDIKYILVKKQK